MNQEEEVCCGTRLPCLTETSSKLEPRLSRFPGSSRFPVVAGASQRSRASKLVPPPYAALAWPLLGTPQVNQVRAAVAEAKEEGVKLRQQIVESPERLQSSLEELTEQIEGGEALKEALKKEVEALGQKKAHTAKVRRKGRSGSLSNCMGALESCRGGLVSSLCSTFVYALHSCCRNVWGERV